MFDFNGHLNLRTLDLSNHFPYFDLFYWRSFLMWKFLIFCPSDLSLNIRWSVCFLSSFTHKLFLNFSIFFVPVKIFSLFLSPDLSFCIFDSQFLESKLELGVAKLCHRVEVIRHMEIGKNMRIVAGKCIWLANSSFWPLLSKHLS